MFVQTTCSIPGVAYVGVSGTDTYGRSVLWRDKTNNLWCWYDNRQAKWVISAQIGYYLRMSSPSVYNFVTNFQLFNGQAYWTANGNMYIWYSTTLGWVLTFNSIGSGTAEWVIGGTTPNIRYGGNEWWKSNSGLTGTYAQRGMRQEPTTYPKIIDANPILRSAGYWLKDGAQTYPFGEYTAMGSFNGQPKKSLGIVRMKDTTDKTYTQNSKTDIYAGWGEIHFDSGAWVIGTRQSLTGWFECTDDMPTDSSKSSVTFVNSSYGGGTFVMVGGSKAPDIVVSFDTLIQGSYTETFYICEAIRWLTPQT